MFVYACMYVSHIREQYKLGFHEIVDHVVVE